MKNKNATLCIKMMKERIYTIKKLMCIKIRNLNKTYNFLLILLRFIDTIRALILGGYLYKYVLPELLKY